MGSTTHRIKLRVCRTVNEKSFSLVGFSVSNIFIFLIRCLFSTALLFFLPSFLFNTRSSRISFVLFLFDRYADGKMPAQTTWLCDCVWENAQKAADEFKEDDDDNEDKKEHADCTHHGPPGRASHRRIDASHFVVWTLAFLSPFFSSSHLAWLWLAMTTRWSDVIMVKMFPNYQKL